MKELYEFKKSDKYSCGCVDDQKKQLKNLQERIEHMTINYDDFKDFFHEVPNLRRILIGNGLPLAKEYIMNSGLLTEDESMLINDGVEP